MKKYILRIDIPICVENDHDARREANEIILSEGMMTLTDDFDPKCDKWDIDVFEETATGQGQMKMRLVSVKDQKELSETIEKLSEQFTIGLNYE